MADNPDPRPGQVTVAIPVNDVPHAPFIFYDGAPVAGYANGVINLTLSATRTYIGPDGAPKNDLVVVAHSARHYSGSRQSAGGDQQCFVAGHANDGGKDELNATFKKLTTANIPDLTSRP